MEQPINFEGKGLCYFVNLEFRPPKKGEYYLSGAIVAAYQAPNDLSDPYYVVKPTYHAKTLKQFRQSEVTCIN